MKTLTRKEVYDAVWSKPLMHLASDFGVSGSYLKRFCTDRDIPTPPVGYWNLPEAKRARLIPDPLPPAQDGQERVQIGMQATFVRQRTKEDRALFQRHKAEAIKLEVPEKVTRWHRLLDDERRNVGRDIDKRAARFVNFLLFELERRGFSTGRDDKGWLEARDPDRITFRAREALRQVKTHHPKPTLPRRPTLYDKARQYVWRPTTTALEPTGELVFEIVAWGAFSERRWRDEPGSPIETHVASIIAAFEEGRAKQIARREEEEAQRRHKEARLAQAEAVRVAREREAARWKAFMGMVDQWTAAERARAFLAAFEAAGRPDNLKLDGAPLSEALIWAAQRIAQLDPLTPEPLRNEDSEGSSD